MYGARRAGTRVLTRGRTIAAMQAFPPPREPLGESGPPGPAHEPPQREPPWVVDEGMDVFGAEDAALRLVERLEEVRAHEARVAPDGVVLLSPPLSAARDHLEGPVSAPTSLVVFGAYGTPGTKGLDDLLERLRRRHPADLCIAWRHFPDPPAHPRAPILALAAEAAASEGRFWALHHALLRLRHDDPVDLHAAARRASLDPERLTELMRAGTGSDRIVDDVASAMESGVTSSPTLFVDGERYRGELTIEAVASALRAHGDA
jgi:protein-disulfide isomerase